MFGRAMATVLVEAACVLILVTAAPGGVVTPRIVGMPTPPAPETFDHAGAPVIEPVEFFDQVVRRYRQLARYVDRVHLTQTLDRTGQPSHRTDTELRCAIDQEQLEVQPPIRQASGALGWPPPVRVSP